MKAAGKAVFCQVYFIVQRMDRPSGGTARQAAPPDGAGRLPGKPEQNAVPAKGDRMGKARARNSFLAHEDKYHIIFVHTAASFKGAAAFFSSTYFYQFPNQITIEYSIFITGVPAILRVRLFFVLSRIYFLFRGRAPPFQS